LDRTESGSSISFLFIKWQKAALKVGREWCLSSVFNWAILTFWRLGTGKESIFASNGVFLDISDMSSFWYSFSAFSLKKYLSEDHIASSVSLNSRGGLVMSGVLLSSDMSV
jgi:hypothetical protein